MSKINQKIYRIIEPDNTNYPPSFIYDAIMVIAIIASIIPLMFRQQYAIFQAIETFTTTLFIIDYILRWTTANCRVQESGWRVYVRYPFTAMAIIDLLSILPGLSVVNKSFKLLRMMRLMRVFRVLKLIRYSNHINVLMTVLVKEKTVLLSVLVLAIAYIFITALIMFNAELYFKSFFEALYWATTTLTTVGYGDIYPHTDLGRFISMVSAIFGVAIIALPSGIITASYLEQLKERNSADKDKFE